VIENHQEGQRGDPRPREEGQRSRQPEEV